MMSWAAFLGVVILLILSIGCQAGLLLQASALINQDWLRTGAALRRGLSKTALIIACYIVLAITLTAGLGIIGVGLGSLAVGPISAAFVMVFMVALTTYCILRITYFIPALVIHQSSVWQSLKTSLRLTNDVRKLFYTLIGLSMSSVIILALVSMPYALLWLIGSPLFGGQEFANMLAGDQVVMSALAIVATLLSMLIRAWSIPLFFLILVEMFHELDDATIKVGI